MVSRNSSPVLLSPARPTGIAFDEDGPIFFFDPATGARQSVSRPGWSQHGVALAPDGKTLAVFGPLGRMEICPYPRERNNLQDAPRK